MKLPRTFHLPWSPGVSSDDKVHTSLDQFLGVPLVITEKLDGECQGWSQQAWHLRSDDSTIAGELRSRSKSYWAQIRYQLDPDCVYFVEDISNLHSIEYTDMSQLFWLIGIYHRGTQTWASYDEVTEAAMPLGLKPTPFLTRCIPHSIAQLQAVTTQHAIAPSILGQDREGVVIRVDAPFEGWTIHTAKWVRAGHVQTSDRWESEQLQALHQK